MRHLGPVGISAILCSIFLVVAAAGVMASRSGEGDRATAATQPAEAVQQPGTRATGDVLQCPGGGQAETFFSQVGSEFRIVGRLASADADQLLVKGPERYVKLNIAEDAKIDGALEGGQIIKASGNFDDNGDAQATDVQPACSAPVAVAAITAAPTPFPFTPEATAVPVVQPAAKPKQVHKVAVAIEPTPRPTPKPKSGLAVAGDHKPGKDKHDKHDGD